MSQWQEAFRVAGAAVGVYWEVGDRQGEGNTLNNIELTHHKLGYYPQALDYYQQSLGISREIGDRAEESGILTNIGIIHRTPRKSFFRTEGNPYCHVVLG